ncbi:LOW QUALITY PROTEIN: bombesin receptor subtype-3-like [Amphiura filiformis]|uniref:LOW QUALITY PROTEIN: bombesin receptor subtype-3-like n=1 Tax=Amphiura filiformis TaxID=82378 RepID=UPI003B221841
MDATTPYSLLLNSSDASNFTDEGPICSLTELKQIWSPILLTIFSIFGIVGNTALFVVIIMNPSLRTSPNVMMMNLTIGDLIYLLLSAPIHIEHEIHPCWQFGTIGCKLINTLQTIGVCVCVLSLTAVSIERYLAITRQVRIGRGKIRCQTAVVVTVIWLVSIAFGLPMAIMAEIRFEVICFPFHLATIRRRFMFMVFFWMYVFPLGVIAICYIRMASALVRSTQSFSGESQTAGAHQFIMRRRLAFIVLTISVFFGVFWFPYHIYKIWFHFVFDPDIHHHSASSHFVRQFHFFMAFANSCFNPWIVFLMSSKHRKGVLKCFKKEDDKFTTNSRSLASVSRARNSGHWATEHGNQYTEMSAMKTEDGATVHHANNVYETT